MVDRRFAGEKPLSFSSSFSLLSFWFIVVFVASSLLEPTFQQQRNSSASLSSEIELSALFDLRSSLGVRSRDWPRKSDPCRFWAGILCGGDGRVVGIDVSGFRRTRIGRQNPRFEVNAMVNLTRLRIFNASRFTLLGSIPDWFGQSQTLVSSLQTLDLRYCSVSGSIPFSIGGLTSLTGLYLSGNNLSGSIPLSLGNLSSLSILDLSQNSLSGSVPSSLSNLARLTALDLSSNSLLGPIPEEIGKLLGLQILNLSSNNLNGSLSDDFFNVQSKLQVLDLRHNGFAGEFPSQVWTLSNLSFIDISGNNFTGQFPNSTSITHPAADNISVLNVSGNLFYGNLSAALIRFSSIDLSDNYFQGKVPGFVSVEAGLVGNCLSELRSQRSQSDCRSFYAKKGLVFDNFGLPSPAQPPNTNSLEKRNRNRTLIIILASVFGGIGLILLLASLVGLILFCRRKRGGNGNQRGVGVGAVPPISSTSPPTTHRGVSVNFSAVGDAFTYDQLFQATGGFGDSSLVKNGHSGDLFRGILESGVPVIVKKIELRSVKKESHVSELEFFARVAHHARFVPLLGHCLESEEEKYLVYKYMPNGDLSSSLYRKSKNNVTVENKEEEGLQSLDWITRLKIALGAAEGLSYLHHECNPPLVHRDVQASSILLDDKFEVRLGSLSEVCPQEGETHQSKITRLLRLPQSSEQGASGTPTALCSYDVYCFGKVLLELVTGKLGISASGNSQTKEWLDQTLPYISIYEKDLVGKILDPSLIVDEDLLEEVWAMAVVARSCLNPKPARRPPMRYILKALENPLKVVREENSGSMSSARLRTGSSRGSWNAALFGSWRSSSDVGPAGPSGSRPEGSGLKRSGTTGSQGSGPNGNGNGNGDHSSSRRRNSREIFPEPVSSSIQQDVGERLDQNQP